MTLPWGTGSPASLFVLLALPGALNAVMPEGAKAQAEALEPLNWMSGCWMDRDGEASSEEVWTSASGGLLLGVSRSLSPTGGVAFEYMRIHATADGVTLFASPGGDPATAFPAVEVSADRLRVERPDHDFPRAIEYRPVGADSMVVLVFGDVGPVEPAFTLRFARVRCPGGSR